MTAGRLAVNADDDGAMQGLYRAAVGPNADFYIPKFLRFDQPGAARTSWNWPAFFASFYWFLYRRMYGPWAIFCLLIPLALSLLMLWLAALQMPRWLVNLIGLGYSFGVAAVRQLPISPRHQARALPAYNRRWHTLRPR